MTQPTGEFISTSDQFTAVVRSKIDHAAREFLDDAELADWQTVPHGYLYAILLQTFTALYGEVPPPVVAMIEMSAFSVGERIVQLRSES